MKSFIKTISDIFESEMKKCNILDVHMFMVNTLNDKLESWNPYEHMDVCRHMCRLNTELKESLIFNPEEFKELLFNDIVADIMMLQFTTNYYDKLITWYDLK